MPVDISVTNLTLKWSKKLYNQLKQDTLNEN